MEGSLGGSAWWACLASGDVSACVSEVEREREARARVDRSARERREIGAEALRRFAEIVGGRG